MAEASRPAHGTSFALTAEALTHSLHVSVCNASQDLAGDRQKHQDQLAAQAAAKEAALAPARKLSAAIIFKGYKLTTPQVSVGNKQPYVDAEGCMHWPVLLMYPETGQQDVIEDWHEDDSIAEHLDVVRWPEHQPAVVVCCCI